MTPDSSVVIALHEIQHTIATLALVMSISTLGIVLGLASISHRRR